MIIDIINDLTSLFDTHVNGYFSLIGTLLVDNWGLPCIQMKQSIMARGIVCGQNIGPNYKRLQDYFQSYIDTESSLLFHLSTDIHSDLPSS